MSSSSDLVALLVRCRTGIATILQQSHTRQERAEALAKLLHELLPQSVLAACTLSGLGETSLTVHPAADPEQKILLRSRLSTLNPLIDEVQRLPAETLPNARLIASAIHADDRPRGFLAIGLRMKAAKEDVVRAEAVLTAAASTLALGWSLETLQREQEELARFALVGQAFIGLTHELNNALNSMMLQTSVVQLRVDQQARQDLAAIRQHGAQAAGLVRSLQHIVQERREKSYPVDLNSVFLEVLEDETRFRNCVTLDLSSSAPIIHSTRSAIKQLVRLLMEGVCAGTKTAVQAATHEQAGSAVLNLRVSAAEGDATVEALLWQNLDEVGRLAGQSLLRQLGGTVTVEQSDRAFIMRVIWRQT